MHMICLDVGLTVTKEKKKKTSVNLAGKRSFVERAGGQPSFHVQAKSEIVCVGGGESSFQAQTKFEIVCKGGGLVIFPCPGQIWNFVWGWVTVMSALNCAHHPILNIFC